MVTFQRVLSATTEMERIRSEPVAFWTSKRWARCVDSGVCVLCAAHRLFGVLFLLDIQKVNKERRKNCFVSPGEGKVITARGPAE